MATGYRPGTTRLASYTIAGLLANMDAQPMSFMSRIGDLPEPEEIFTAYETQKNVIKQLKDQVPILRKK